VLTMQMSLTGPQFENRARATQVLNEGLRRIMALSGVEVAAIASSLPMEPQGGLPFQIPGRPEGPASGGAAIWTRVSAGYFETFKVPVVRGRTFTEGDESGQSGLIINETLAKEFCRTLIL